MVTIECYLSERKLRKKMHTHKKREHQSRMLIFGKKGSAKVPVKEQ